MTNYTSDEPTCHDCGMAYTLFGVDTTLPNNQWYDLLAKDGLFIDRLLCANCIAKRAKLNGAIAMRCVLDYPNPRV